MTWEVVLWTGETYIIKCIYFYIHMHKHTLTLLSDFLKLLIFLSLWPAGPPLLIAMG